MGQILVRQEILDMIKARPHLLADLAVIMNRDLEYTIKLVRRGDVCLTQASTLQIIKQHLQIEDESQLLIKMPMPENLAA